MKKIESHRMQPIRDVVYQQIRKAILRGDLRPGERLAEEQLASEMGTSRTPVREALRKLEVEKMVRYHPHKGVVIAEIPADEIGDIYEIRANVEALLAKHAARNATPEDIKHLCVLLDKAETATTPEAVSDYIDQYNHMLSKIADAPVLEGLAKSLRETLCRMLVATYLKPVRRPEAQREHREIVTAIAMGNEALAYQLTIQHIQNAAQVLEGLEPKQDESDKP
ncbi:MAG: GntR family transcriptional regulator [Oscillospiraceae bacterium]|nr:GntR family transcriptional regulator [Oscillospiraceae bacterium]